MKEMLRIRNTGIRARCSKGRRGEVASGPDVRVGTPAGLLGVLLAGLLLSASGADAAGGDGLTIASNGTSPYVIAYAEQVDRERVTQAAAALQMFLGEATGATLPIVAESDIPEGSPAFYLGRTRAARQAGLPVDELEGWTYLNRVVGRDIFLVGEDRPSFIAPGPRPRVVGVFGSFKAVTAFLESQVGVRFLMPGEFGTHVPRHDPLVIDADMNERWAPVFTYLTGRMSNYYPRHKNSLRDTAFGFANHMFGQSEMVFDYGGHSYYTAVPKDQYWESNPEYFAEVGGIRSPKGNHLCISNSAVQQLMIDEMLRQLDRGFVWVELEQTDGYIPCQCTQCRVIHPDPNERVWIVHRQLAERMQKLRPNKKVMLTAYQPTRLPPKSFSSFPDNVALRLTRYRPEDFAMWERWGARDVPKGLYTTNWLTVHPQVSAYVAVMQNRLFQQNQVKGMYLCGGIILNGKGNWYPWGLGGPGFYAFFKSAHDPSLDPVALRGEYIEAAFGEAAPAMLSFFATLDERMDQFWWLFRADSDNSPPSRLVDMNGEFSLLFYPPHLLKQLDQSLARAQQQANDERVRARLKLVALEYEYLKQHALVHHFHRAYNLAPSRESLALLEEQVGRFFATRERIWPDGKLTVIEGLPGPFSGTTYKIHRWVAEGAPFNWDFALLREKGVLPGTGTSKTQASPLESVTLDGKLDDPAWQDIPFVEIGEIAMGKAPNLTQFKVAYDRENLYVGFRAELSSPDELDYVKPVGRDGTAWRQENLELVIDPLGSRRMYYHFVINPVANSTLDRRFGYHQAPDHPLFQKFEWNWDGDWSYRAQVDKAKQQWTAEVKIPFATLDVERPTAGAQWTMNIGRTQFVGGPGDSRNAAAYLWSPNIQSRTFHDPAMFGELTFK